jgi:hypothetical protein
MQWGTAGLWIEEGGSTGSPRAGGQERGGGPTARKVVRQAHHERLTRAQRRSDGTEGGSTGSPRTGDKGAAATRRLGRWFDRLTTNGEWERGPLPRMGILTTEGGASSRIEPRVRDATTNQRRRRPIRGPQDGAADRSEAARPARSRNDVLRSDGDGAGRVQGARCALHRRKNRHGAHAPSRAPRRCSAGLGTGAPSRAPRRRSAGLGTGAPSPLAGEGWDGGAGIRWSHGTIERPCPHPDPPPPAEEGDRRRAARRDATLRPRLP